jgi:predicted transposase YbfD/YdcC
LVLLLIGLFLGVDPQELNQQVGQAQRGGNPNGQVQGEQRPPTAEEERTRKFTATILRFTEVVWDEQFRKAGERYIAPRMVLFSDQVPTGCGVAPSAVGPFYCPRDKTVYLDPTFFEELEDRLGGSKAEFSQAYVIAHEVGHHVQNLLGYSELVERKRRTLPKEAYNEWSVRLVEHAGARRHITKETGHGREETRHYVQMPAPKTLPGIARWKGLLTIGVAMLYCLRDGQETAEIRYYVSSLALGVKRFAHAVRGHWGIENTCHWSLDMTYREDESRIRDQHLRENFAWLNRFTLSLLKQHPGKHSLVMKRRSCGWNDDFLLEILTSQTS